MSFCSQKTIGMDKGYRKIIMKIFVCPTLTGCHLPLYKAYSHFIGAKNINEAKKSMMEFLKNECKEQGLSMVEYYGAIKLEGRMSNDVFYVSKMVEKKMKKVLKMKIWHGL